TRQVDPLDHLRAGVRMAELLRRGGTSREGIAAGEVDDGEGSLGRPCGLALHRERREYGRRRPRRACTARSHREGDAEGMPEVHWTMNNTLAATGIHHPEHRKRAIAIGEKVGLYGDWPVSKGCTPPYVPVCVEAMVKRRG